MSNIFRSRLAGALFLMAFPLYGGGQALIIAGYPSVGAALMVTNSAAVIAIGVLLKTIIARDAPLTANIYQVARIAEGLLLGFGALAWIYAPQGFNGAELNAVAYRCGMIVLGVGSIGFCRWLIGAKRALGPLAWLGLIGYSLLVLAMIADFAGEANLAMALLAPGALFELVLGSSLLIKGIGDPNNGAQRTSNSGQSL